MGVGGGAQECPATTPTQVCTKHGLGLVSWGPYGTKGKGLDFLEFPWQLQATCSW